MYGKLHIVPLVLFLSLLALPCRAQESVGIFNSPKGFGASVRFGGSQDVYHTINAFIDIYGVPTSRCSYPGFRINASRNYILSRQSWQDVDMTFYLGPGFTAGYVRDHDKGRGIDLVSLFGDNEGVALAISGGAGCQFDFGGRIALDLSFTSDLGVHIRRNEDERGYFSPSVSIFNNGILQAFYPQLTIFFKL